MNGVSSVRNKVIARVFEKMELVEQWRLFNIMRMTNPQDVSNFLNEIKNPTTISDSFFKPFHLVILGIEQKRDPKKLKASSNLVSYARIMGLSAFLDESSHEFLSSNGLGTGFLRIVSLDHVDKVSQASEHLSVLVGSSLSTALMELLENCFSHGLLMNRGLSGLVCAQTWLNGNLGQIAIADPGIGIRQSLSECHGLIDQLNQDNACHLAAQYGVTSKPGEHSGYGLTLAHDLMKQVNGNLIIYSGGEYFSIKNNVIDKGLAEDWKGTIIILEWQLDKVLDVKSVYDAWPISEGFNENDFNF